MVMTTNRTGGEYDRFFVTIVTPFNEKGQVDEGALRNHLRHYLQERFIEAGGGMIINPEAGEVFTLTCKEKVRNIEIALEECGGKIPVFSGAVGLSTKESVEAAVQAKQAGAEGLFLFPPIGGLEVTIAWDADKHPEIWGDVIKAQAKATDLPIIIHPEGGSYSPIWGNGLPLAPTLYLCEKISNIVGWKMTYDYDSFWRIARGFRSLDRHVAILGANANRFPEYMLHGFLDGAASGFLNYAMEPLMDHVSAWRIGDITEAMRIWSSGLSEALRYSGSGGKQRLHVRYKVATWMRGLITDPFMRPPVPKPTKEEVLLARGLLTNLGLGVILEREMNRVLEKLDR
jgi:4-hydroxy-tetrahydrodipicolinate synthase